MRTHNESWSDAYISDDHLWFLARYDVILEREGIEGIVFRYAGDQHWHIGEIRSHVYASRELELRYSGILECAFENYDIDNPTQENTQ